MKKWITYAAIALLIIWILLLLYSRLIAFSDEYEEENEDPTNPQLNCSRPLRLGVIGPEVRVFQQAFNESFLGGLAPIQVDGVFGPDTLRALQDYSQNLDIQSATLNQLNLC